MQMQDQQDEFKKAFMGDAEGATTDTSDPAAADPEAAAPVADAATDAPGNEADGNAPTEDAPEGAGETPAAAVVLNGEGDDDSDVPAEDMQAYKSWRGRLKKREEDLAAREAALAGQEPVALADGGKVEGKGKGEQWNRLTAQENRWHDHESEGQLQYNGSTVSLEDGDGKEVMSTEANRERMFGGEGEELADKFNNAPKTRLADGGEVEDPAGEAVAATGDDTDAILKSFEEDYGPDFVAAIDKLIDKRARAIVEEMGGAYVSDLSSRIEEVMRTAEEGMGRMHGDVLTALRDDAEEIASSPEFQQWIDGLEGEDKANAERVVASGRLKEILALFKQYDGAKGGGEKSPEDVWAEDAAAGVKGSAPIKLPTRAPASPDDEYKRAWAEA